MINHIIRIPEHLSSLDTAALFMIAEHLNISISMKNKHLYDAIRISLDDQNKKEFSFGLYCDYFSNVYRAIGIYSKDCIFYESISDALGCIVYGTSDPSYNKAWE